MRAAAVVLAATIGGLPSAWGERQGEPGAELLAPAGRDVADYYGRARTIVSRETVRLQPLDRQLRPSREWRSS